MPDRSAPGHSPFPSRGPRTIAVGRDTPTPVAAVQESLTTPPAEAEGLTGAAAHPVLESPRRILIRSPEIRIKGRNRPSFREALKRNLGQRLRGIGLRWRASSAGDRVWIEVPPGETAALDRALAAMATVFGVELALPCFVIPRPRGEALSPARLLEDTTSLACGLASGARPEPESGFALRVRRRDRNFPIRSQAVAESVGRAILERTAWDRVDLSNPALTIFIEPHEEAIYLWTRRVKGPGGLPVGVAGRLVGMLSGGFDSPVAAWMMAGRGASLDFVHLTPSRPDPSSPTACKAADLVRVLSRYTGRSRLVLVPYTYFDLRLTGSRTGHEAVLFRRFAFRCGEAVARKVRRGGPDYRRQPFPGRVTDSRKPHQRGRRAFPARPTAPGRARQGGDHGPGPEDRHLGNLRHTGEGLLRPDRRVPAYPIGARADRGSRGTVVPGPRRSRDAVASGIGGRRFPGGRGDRGVRSGSRSVRP